MTTLGFSIFITSSKLVPIIIYHPDLTPWHCDSLAAQPWPGQSTMAAETTTTSTAEMETGVTTSSPPTSAAMSFFEKLRSIITVEVVFFLYFFGTISFYSCLQQYVFDRISQDHHFVKVRILTSIHNLRNDILGTPLPMLTYTLLTLKICWWQLRRWNAGHDAWKPWNDIKGVYEKHILKFGDHL